MRSPPSCTSPSTSRSSTGSTTTSGRWGSRRSSTCASRTRCSSRSGTATTSRASQITMAEDFGVEDRGHFYDPVGALRDVVVNHLMQVVAACRDGGARRAAIRRRSRTRRSRCSARSKQADPAHYVRGQYDGYRVDRRRRGGLDDRDVRGAPARDRELALVGRAVLHPHGQAPAGHADRAAPRLQATAAARLRAFDAAARAEPAGRSSSTRRPASGSSIEAHRADTSRRRADRARHGVRRGGRRRRRRRTRCCCTRR